MKKKLTIISISYLLIVFFSSCEKKPITEADFTIALSQKALDLVVGASLQLEVTGKPSEMIAVFTSANPTIATVDAETGLVLAIAPGETHISVKVGNHTDQCSVRVTALNEMPLLIFEPEVRGEELVDERILAHELLCGRTYTDAVPLNTQIYTFPGFYNKHNDVVTCVVYNLHYDNTGEDLIVAYCTEPITHLDKVKVLLNCLGFTYFEPRKYQGSEEVYIYSPSDNYAGLYLNIRQTDQINLNARSFIHFIWERKKAYPIKYHPLIPNVKDFPSLEKSAAGKEVILAYENDLGYRTYDENKEGFCFTLQDDKLESSNISFAEYQNDEESMGISILCCILAISSQDELQSPAVKEYLRHNGYGQDIQSIFSDTGVLGFNERGDACIVFIEATYGDCWMSLIKQGHHGYNRQALQHIQTHSQASDDEFHDLLRILKK